MTQQEHIVQEPSALHLKPIISYPREAKMGERYLFTIDVQLAEDSPWPYQEEEFEISFILETAPFFTHEPVGEHEPGIVLHRYGGTYGAAEYLLTTSKKVVAPGKIKVTLLNGWGLPIAQLELECEVKEDTKTERKQTTLKVKEEKQLSPFTPFTSPISNEQFALIARQLSMVGWNMLDAWDMLEADILRQGSAIRRINVPPGNIALRGYPFTGNEYLLIIDCEIVGFVKLYIGQKQLPEALDSIILPDSITERSNLKFMKFRITAGESRKDVPFIYHTTGDETILRNYLEPDNTKKVYTFHQPPTLATWLGEARRNPSNLLRDRLLHMPALEQGSLFDYQYEALQRIEQSLAEDHPRTLIQLETSRGKTHIATRSTYRLLEHAKAKHIFYVVDTGLAKQYAFDAFKSYIIGTPSFFEKTSFTDRYRVEIISNEKLDPSVHVYIGTLEDIYTLYASGHKGEHLPVPIRDNASIKTTPSIKDYCSNLPIEYFDVIILAESEHINYQLWQPVLDYFDTFYLGIASSVSDEVLRFFHSHLVYRLVESTEGTQIKQGSTSLLSRQGISKAAKAALGQKIICPFCFEHFTPQEARFRCMNLKCPKRVPDYIYMNARSSREIIMGRVLVGSRNLFAQGVKCDECHVISTTRICPNCHFELSDDVGQVDQRIIAIIGGRATGKTHYIASLITRLQNEVGRNFNITIRMVGDETRERWNRDFYTPLFVNNAPLHPTLSASIDWQTKSPLVFRFTFGNGGSRRRMLNLSFFDLAGEDMTSLETMSSSHYRYICQADGIILLLDPLQIPTLRHQLVDVNLPALDPNAYPEYIVERLYSLFEKVQRLRAHQPVKVPIAFTLSKIDVLLHTMDKSLEASSLLRQPSLHQTYIDLAEMRAVDSEVANYLKIWLGPNFCNIIAEDFATYSYFGVSSLAETSDKNNHMAFFSPSRVEDPFLWILYKLGIIKGK